MNRVKRYFASGLLTIAALNVGCTSEERNPYRQDFEVNMEYEGKKDLTYTREIELGRPDRKDYSVK